jgi:hypothetical protein
MALTLHRWHTHRMLVDHARLLLPYFSDGQRVLFISENNPICHTQIFPYFYHRAELAREHNIEIRELPLARFQSGKHPYSDTQINAIAFQTWFDLAEDSMASLVQRIKITWPDATLAYFDWFAPTDLRYAKILDDHISVYVKKQLLRDHRDYNKSILGDTNLTDFFARRFGLDYPLTHFEIPETFWKKVFVGTHFAFSDHMMPFFQGAFPSHSERPIDIHARIAVKGTEWYTKMRQEALDKTLAMENRLNVVSRGRVSRKEYFAELFKAKLCFSPFGYGEVCWRDFEAMFTGSLLLKPDMSHLDCYPEAFIPFETYIPLAWDLSDFDEKVEYYLRHDSEREAIARNAFELMNKYFRESRFMTHIIPLLKAMDLAS